MCEEEVIVGLVTAPERIWRLAGILSSLANQTVKPKTVYVVVYNNNDVNNRPYIKSVVNTIKNSPLPRGTGKLLLLAEENYGPSAKLLGPLMALLLIRNSDDDGTIPPSPPVPSSTTCLVTINDDRTYGPQLIQSLLEGHKKHPNSAVCLFGHVLGNFPNYWAMSSRHRGHYSTNTPNGRFWETICVKPNTRVDVVCSSGGVLYPVSIFRDKKAVAAAKKQPKSPVYAIPNVLMEDLRKNKIRTLNEFDDLYVSAWMDLLKVRKYVVPYLGKSVSSSSPSSSPHSGGQCRHHKPSENYRFITEIPTYPIKRASSLCSTIYVMRNLGLLKSELQVKWYQSTLNLVGFLGIFAIVTFSAVTAYVYHYRRVIKK